MESKVRESFVKTKLKTFIPVGVQKAMYKGVKKLRLYRHKSKGVITKEDLKKHLLDSGLKEGDTVIVHTSLGRIGYVENGADSLIDAFLEVLGREGTLAMPTFSSPDYDEKSKAYIFDVGKTPAYTGKVPETFRKREGVERSLSPMHSVAACGKHAEYIIKEHEKCDNSYAMNGPFGRLYELDAKIFLIGVDQLANSSIHIVEDKCKFPIKVFTEQLDAVVIDENGERKKIKFRRHLPHLYKIRKNNIMEKYLLEENLMKIYPFGNTELRVIKLRDFVDCMERLLEKGITIYNS